ncbi:hypothetical protein MettiDRAFT_0373 [Methanolobus tindarius DSM 2278]|uniref:Uncharacterized protein n=1 Tax=Methanolobus tindarius DSM 2278 TaxID=1090322 RepID=W9DP80_METTI|nr:hypothetical protein MettiDRAFT_0373 [Methanolobus tindarius DSM 2278]
MYVQRDSRVVSNGNKSRNVFIEPHTVSFTHTWKCRIILIEFIYTIGGPKSWQDMVINNNQ